MPVSCCVVGCAIRAGLPKSGNSEPALSFLRFPKDKRRRRAWISAINRKGWQPNDWNRVCGNHFISGRAVPQKNHPDWVPTRNLGYSKSDVRHDSLARYERTVNRQALRAVESIQDLCNVQENENGTENESNSSIQLSEESGLRILSEVSSLERNVVNLEEENQRLKNELLSKEREIRNLSLENQVFIHAVHDLNSQSKFIANFEKEEDKVIYYTGLPNLDSFKAILMHITQVWKPQTEVALSYSEQLLLVLTKLRLGLSGQDLAYRFDIGIDKVSSIFQEWITILSTELKCLIIWPDTSLKSKLPNGFRKGVFKDTKCIIDCTEILIERASAFSARSQTYSEYKGHNTVKILVAINPWGAVIFLSKCFSGRMSDKEITKNSGFLDLVSPGDVILADRGFDIGDLIAVRGATLKIPAFTRGKNQLSRKEVEEGRQLSRIRIHVERAIGRLKTYRILHSVLPISLVKNQEKCTIDKVLTVCAALCNLKPPLIKRDK